MAGSTALIVANWLAFLCLSSAFILLMLQGFKYKGPVSSYKISPRSVIVNSTSACAAELI